MKKALLALLLTFILTGMLGCKTTSRATLKTDMKQELRQTAVTDSIRSEQKATSDKISEALATSEQKNVVIEFEEWEYYPAANDTATGGNYAQKDGNFMRTSEDADADKPINAGSVKKRRKGTITINADRQTKQTKEQETTSSEDTKVTATKKTNTNIKTKEKTKSTETTGKSKWYVWLILGLVFAAVLIWVGRDIARKAERG